MKLLTTITMILFMLLIAMIYDEPAYNESINSTTIKTTYYGTDDNTNE